MIVYIAWDDAESKPLEFLRICPGCHEPTVIGHGWRQRRADDIHHSTIRIHRGKCKPCHRTITMLPRWLIPGGHYSWTARQQAEQLALEQELPAEQCIPEIADPQRSIDPSTVRRWFHRRWESLMMGLVGLSWIVPPPTLFAWDWKAASRILIAETKPP
ncbi:MAG: hypothetical protein HY011_36480 [Acidobacteria bacterium]|nr:hypothetical protein [Acidobacteriota bacterium]